jgi:hypothetical protein
MAIAAITASASTTTSSLRAPCAGAASSPRAITSCFHSRSECSRANSLEIVSSAPIRFTATRKASSSESPPCRSAATWPRR